MHTQDGQDDRSEAYVCMYVYMNVCVYICASDADTCTRRTDKTIRAVHKYGGKTLTTLAWITCFLGWMHMQSDIIARVAFGAPLVLMAPIVLL